MAEKLELFLSAQEPLTLEAFQTTITGSSGSHTNLTKSEIIAALGYTPQDAAVEKHSYEIENLFPEKITILISDFFKQGSICLFVCQIKVNENINGDYGFNLLKLPFPTLHRFWINYSWLFYVDSEGQFIRMNGENLEAGGYTLSAMYFTDK